MKRETSAEAHREACSRISRNQSHILAWMRGCREGVTSAEVLHQHRIDNVNLWRARFTELADIGAIVAGEPRPCRVTGRRALTWSIAPKPWKPRAKGKSCRKRLADATYLLGRVHAHGPLAEDIRAFLAEAVTS